LDRIRGLSRTGSALSLPSRSSIALRAGRAALWLAFCATGAPVHALEFVELTADGVGRVLLLQDCRAKADKPCADRDTQVSAGDADRLAVALRAGRYAEVWLNSGGGDSREGPRIGQVLRNFGMAVRVREGHLCASACTVAFLGGVIRTVDPGASYLVHAPSGVRNAIPDEMMRRLLAAPESELERVVVMLHDDARQKVFERLQYIQTMIGGQPDVARYRAMQVAMPVNRPPYLSSAEFDGDVARIRIEGAPAAHTVVMNNERAAYDLVLAYLRPHAASLGPRGAAAHRMMETMFSTTIIRTADLTQEVLTKLGFVTPVLGK
jgi:hypothetical protein